MYNRYPRGYEPYEPSYDPDHDPMERYLRRRMWFSIFISLLLVALFIFGLCIYLRASSSPSDRYWASEAMHLAAYTLVGVVIMAFVP